MHLHTSVPFSSTRLLPSLLLDYLNDEPAITFLRKYPFSISAFEQAIADKSNDNTDRKLLVEVLQSHYADIPTTNAVSDNITSLLSEKTFTVTAAHQPCLFMGPIYNIYKISCSINLAQQLKNQYPEHHFVPVFWLGSEDHDTPELNHAFINTVKVEWKEPGRGAAGRWKTATMQEAVDELKLHGIDEQLITMLQKGIDKYPTFGKFTQYFVNEIFKDHGLVVLDQDNARLKNKFSEVIKDEVLHSRAVQVLKENIEFLDNNYKAQAKPRDINFFYLGDNYRERIILNSESGQYEVNNTSISFSKDEIIKEIEDHPERFSPNVIYRPLYQEMTLPNLAFIGGAGELSYWLELKPLFEYYKVNYPVQVLRNSAVILSSAIQKKLEKLNLKAEDFFEEIEALITKHLKQNLNGEASLSDEKNKLEALFNTVITKAEKTDITLKQTAAGEKQKLLASLQTLEAKMLKAEKRRQETTINQIRSIHAAIFLDGKLQERATNFLSYYTSEFIPMLVKELDAFTKSIKILTNT